VLLYFVSRKKGYAPLESFAIDTARIEIHANGNGFRLTDDSDADSVIPHRRWLQDQLD
jgi:hypothetical protein